MTTIVSTRVAALGGAVIILLLSVGAGFTRQPHAQEEFPVAELSTHTHFHGLAVDRADPSRLYLATHHGLYVVTAEGTATRVSDNTNDYMGFTPHPTDPTTLFASGHPTGGGNMGVLLSRNGGVSWSALAAGSNGPVDFHQMTISAADPQVIYGAYAGGLQVSRDGGQSWEVIGPSPEGLIDLALSAHDPNTLYAATQRGLLTSTDGGRIWREAYSVASAATMVEVTAAGEVYAFVAGTGLVRASESELSWTTLRSDFGNAVLLHLTADPTTPTTLYAATFDPQQKTQELLRSGDGGATWSPL